MLKHKQYFIIVTGIFVAQIFFANLFIHFLEGSELQQKQIAFLQKKKRALDAEVAALNATKGRSIASLPAGAKAQVSDLNFDLSDMYFSQIEKLKKEQNKDAALEVIQKLQSGTQNKEYIAQAEFEKISLTCTSRLETGCMKQIDSIVTQFPQSNWTAKSLLLLSHFYYKQNRIAESRSLIQTIQKEFKNYVDFNHDIQKFASQNL